MGRPPYRRNGPGNHPATTHPAFVDHLAELLGAGSTALQKALNSPAPVSIRTNGLKWAGPGTTPVPWCSTGNYLEERPAFTFDPLLHAGCYYVQEASSMLLEQAFKATRLQDRDICALDLCAAPGGKTTHLRSLLTPGSLLVANEVDRKRLSILEENVWKWGAPNTVITGGAANELVALEGFFDLVLVDAPCSGQGMFRKDPFAREQWTPELVQQCAATQKGILHHAYNSLRAGGWLIYSTCTWEPAENEEALADLVERGALAHCIPADPAWGVVSEERNGITGLRCYPHRVRGEGFFIALLQKPGEHVEAVGLHNASRSTNIGADVLPWLQAHEQFRTVDHHGILFAVPLQWSNALDRLAGAMHVRSPGIPLAEQKGNDLRPHRALALSTQLDRSRFHSVPLDLDSALAFLHGAALPASAAHGSALATYANVPLGWLHGAGNRWNNRWPVAWRIRAHQPSAPTVSWAPPKDSDPVP